MKINWLTVARIGASVVGQIVPGVQVAESLAESLGGLSGDQKKQAIIDLVKNGALAAEGITSTDVALNPELEAAVGGIVDAVVNLHTIIAKVHAAHTATV